MIIMVRNVGNYGDDGHDNNNGNWFWFCIRM